MIKLKLCEISIEMEIEKLEALNETQEKIYNGLSQTRVASDRDLRRAYESHLQERKWIEKYRGRR